MKAPAFTATGASKPTITLDNAVFGVQPNHELLHQAYVIYLGNQRVSHAKTRSRGLVAGGGKKPWRQKGTGRARTGSIRNPLWRGGGVIFGPTGEQNYRRQLPVKMRRAALWQALSAQAEAVRVIEKFAFTEPKTQAAANLLAKLEAEGSVLVIADQPTEATIRSVRNLAGVQLLGVRQLNVAAILNADQIIIEQSALDYLSQRAKASHAKSTTRITATTAQSPATRRSSKNSSSARGADA